MVEKKEIIENYLMGRLTEEEKAIFEKELKNDPSLQQKVNQYKSLLRGIELSFNRELKARLRDEEKKIREKSSSPMSKQKFLQIGFAMAAVIALIIVSVFVLNKNKIDAEQILAVYYEPYPNVESPVTRGKQDRQPGYALYEEGQYKGALKLFGAHLNEFPDDPAALFYSGICYFELGNTRKSIEYLQSVNKLKNNRYSRPAKWYEALAYVKLKNTKHSKELFMELSKGNDIYSRQSKEILEKMN